jgi:ectoine hydroxylase-related dioxygenase (phytanoyl-CoA dioxygenase family)
MNAPRDTAVPDLVATTLTDARGACDEIRRETDRVDASWLDHREQLAFRAFSLAYRLATRVRRRPFLSEVLSDRASLERRQKPRLRTYGPCREEAGGHLLTREQRSFFETQGFVGPLSLGLGPTAIERLRKAALTTTDTFTHLQCPELLALALDDRITDRVASVLGPDVDIVRSGLFIKEGRSKSEASQWHMAPSSNYGASERHDETDFVTVWVALTPARPEHGCLKILPGSFSIYPNNLLTEVAELAVYLDDPFDAFLAWNLKRKIFGRNDGVSAARSKFDAYISDRVNGAVILQKMLGTNDFLYRSLETLDRPSVHLAADAGEFVMFTSENYHASLPNISDITRVAFAIRYGRPSAPLDRPKNVATLVDTLPERLRARLSPTPGERWLPVVRARGTPVVGRRGTSWYFAPDELDGP